MQRWQGAALVVALCSGCLEPMVGDDPGYSRNLLPQGSAVPSAYAELSTSHKIDRADGLSVPLVPVSNGFADGNAVRYWDMGMAGRSASSVYALANCGPEGQPLPGSKVDQWPILFESVPGDGDYTPYRAISWVCVTEKYSNQIISSGDALGDAIKLGLLREPIPAAVWVNLPIVAAGVEVAGTEQNRPALTGYYKGTTVTYYSFEDQEGTFPYEPKQLVAGKVYEIFKSGAMAPVRVIFSQPYMKDGVRNPMYSPYWNLFTVTLTGLKGANPEALAADAAVEEMAIQSWTKEGDILAAQKQTPSRIQSVVASMTNPRVNRPFVVEAVAP
jgi:hypothetical protein